LSFGKGLEQGIGPKFLAQAPDTFVWGDVYIMRAANRVGYLSAIDNFLIWLSAFGVKVTIFVRKIVVLVSAPIDGFNSLEWDFPYESRIDITLLIIAAPWVTVCPIRM
jgi:hypothetical protein